MTIDIEKLREAAERATPGKSWINLLQSNGCEVQLFDRQYTIWLAVDKTKNYKQTEIDGMYIALANPSTILALLKERELLREVCTIIKEISGLRTTIHDKLTEAIAAATYGLTRADAVIAEIE